MDYLEATKAMLDRIDKLEKQVKDIQLKIGSPVFNPEVQVASEFWKVFNSLNSVENQPFNHSLRYGKQIAINMNHVYTHCADVGIELPPLNEVISQIQREPTFIKNKTVRSRLTHASVRCFIFKRT